MISRRTTLTLAEVYADWFRDKRKGKGNDAVDDTMLYDTLYRWGMSVELMNAMRRIRSRRELKEFIMKLETGEFTFVRIEDKYQRKSEGESYLERLAEDLLNEYDNWNRWRRFLFRGRRKIETIKQRLEEDGKPYRLGVVRRNPVVPVERYVFKRGGP